MAEATAPKRADPFPIDLGDFQPGATRNPKPKPDPAQTRASAEAQGFVSREPAPRKKAEPKPKKVTQKRHRRTGRTHPLQVRTTPELAERFGKLADAEGKVYGELLEHMLEVYETHKAKSA